MKQHLGYDLEGHAIAPGESGSMPPALFIFSATEAGLLCEIPTDRLALVYTWEQLLLSVLE